LFGILKGVDKEWNMVQINVKGFLW
jgi:hypothetical protein